MIAGALIILLRPPRTRDEAMRKMAMLMRMAQWLLYLNLFALSATLTLIWLLRWAAGP